eukprot:Phypoly_transcript_22739.p1 GENE.Phypoly_transcript_22739~~Phypoly_transcript_22739.p1  ORF type:complete len:191 (+),score=9.38 Phypoly_transcript_22739:48-575(+)
MTKYLSLPVQYSPYCTLSITSDRISYISENYLVEIWPTNGELVVTSQAIPASLSGQWLTLQEDPFTGNFYYYVKTLSYVSSFWQGTRTDRGNRGETVQWTLMTAWPSPYTPGIFTLDTRNENSYGGPLFCSADSFDNTMCNTVQKQTAWTGPRLKPAFYGGGGITVSPLYDPACQ